MDVIMDVIEGPFSQIRAQYMGWIKEPYESNNFLKRYNEPQTGGKKFVCKIDEVLPKNLRKVNLSGANLVDANLEGAELDGAKMEGTNLQDANLKCSNIRRANLKGANMNGTNLIGANLAISDLEGARMEGANLLGTNLRHANLRHANLKDAELVDASLIEADMTNADLSGATVDEVSILCETKKWHGVDFTNTVLYREEPLSWYKSNLMVSRRTIIERMVELEITDAKGLGNGYKRALANAGLEYTGEDNIKPVKVAEKTPLAYNKSEVRLPSTLTTTAVFKAASDVLPPNEVEEFVNNIKPVKAAEKTSLAYNKSEVRLPSTLMTTTAVFKAASDVLLPNKVEKFVSKLEQYYTRDLIFNN